MNDTSSHAINMLLCNIFCFIGCFDCSQKYRAIEAFRFSFPKFSQRVAPLKERGLWEGENPSIQFPLHAAMELTGSSHKGTGYYVKLWDLVKACATC